MNNHYDCKYFEAIFDGIATDCYCNKKKEWFWVVEDVPICEFFDIVDDPVYSLEEMELK